MTIWWSKATRLLEFSRSCRKRYAGNNCNPAFLWRKFFVTEELGILVVGWGFTQHNAMGDGSDDRQVPKGPRWSGVKRGISTQHSGRELFWTQVPLLQCKDICSEIKTWFKPGHENCHVCHVVISPQCILTLRCVNALQILSLRKRSCPRWRTSHGERTRKVEPPQLHLLEPSPSSLLQFAVICQRPQRP